MSCSTLIGCSPAIFQVLRLPMPDCDGEGVVAGCSLPSTHGMRNAGFRCFPTLASMAPQYCPYNHLLTALGFGISIGSIRSCMLMIAAFLLVNFWMFQ
ncbi:hypothetical protein GOP47_0003817 [Adiantum capillus-veneris]|uniref:Uncharacterized protein n=1 Tax=Adiantum capillus-veneris TaxID=13818 RepID=A0A9D4ZM92_ADICA|nr:hypothetical protein GOP47_0003817 [Adiantum capillus-veneris]